MFEDAVDDGLTGLEKAEYRRRAYVMVSRMPADMEQMLRMVGTADETDLIALLDPRTVLEALTVYQPEVSDAWNADRAELIADTASQTLEPCAA